MIHTVTGPIEASDLGRTSMHEHLYIDTRPQFAASSEGDLSGLEVRLDTLGTVRWNPNAVIDNLIIDDADVLVAELADMASLGASGIVDLTVVGLEPRVADLVEIAERTELNIMVGCGFYIHGSHPDWIEEADEQRIADHLLGELTEGVGDTGILPALVGELGTSDPVTDRELKVVAAGGRAAAQTGAAVNIHLEPRGRNALAILEVLTDRGVPADRVVFSHLDECLDLDYHRAIARAGAILEYDCFGQEWYYSPDRYKDPSDHERCEALATLVAEGYGDQVVLGCDVCMKSCLKAYGGQGYDHLFRRIAPWLTDGWQVPAATVERMLVDTPRRLLDRPS